MTISSMTILRAVRNPNDVLFGALLIASGLLALYLSRDLRLGTAVRMGPGYVPQLLCWVQAALGAGIVLMGFWGNRERLEAWALRPLVTVLASILFFAVAIERLGLLVAVVGLVVLAVLAQRKVKVAESALLAGSLAAFSALLFVQALGLPLRLWPLLEP